MGVGLVPFYEPRVPDAATYNGDGKGLAQEFDVLEQIAADAGLRPLSEFASDAILDAEDPDGQGGDLSYHAIQDVMPTVDGLVREIRENPDIASQLSDPAYTLEELGELTRSLRAAAALGARVALTFW
jgi:hypothetical protein